MKNRNRIGSPPKVKVKLPSKASFAAVNPWDYIMLFFGPPGVGKSTFVNKLADNVLFLSTDRGTRFMKTMRVECHSWEKFMATVDAIAKEPDKYDLVCVDHVDDMANMAEDWVCEQLGIDALGDAGFGKGWKLYRQQIHNFTQKLMALNIGVVFICHESIKTIRTRRVELERTMPMLSKSAWNVIVPIADLIGYCGYKTLPKEKGGKEIRILETIPREDLYVKDRTRRRRPEDGTYELLNGRKFIETFGDESDGEEKQEKRGRRAR